MITGLLHDNWFNYSMITGLLHDIAKITGLLYDMITGLLYDNWFTL